MYVIDLVNPQTHLYMQFTYHIKTSLLIYHETHCETQFQFFKYFGPWVLMVICFSQAQAQVRYLISSTKQENKREYCKGE